MMSINKRQNSELNLKRLAAQRQLYSDAKKLMHIQFTISGIVLMILAVIGNVIDDQYAVYIVITAIFCAIIDELFISKRVDGLKQNAANIQEEFDCEVLQIPENHLKYRLGSTLEKTQEYSKKYLVKHDDYDLFKNWYPGIDGDEDRSTKIKCQKTNCWWNQNLREKYSAFLILSTISIFVVLLIVVLLKDITLNGFIMSVLSPIIPGVVLVYKIIRDNKKTISNLNHTKSKLDEIMEKLKSKSEYPDGQFQSDVRCLQDLIFDIRVTSPLIADKFYFWYRERYEEIARDTNKDEGL